MKQIVVVCAHKNAQAFMSLDNCNLMDSIAHVCNAYIVNKVRENTGIVTKNFYPAWENEKKTKPQFYKRNDLNQWSEEARKQGKNGFYARPVDPEKPYGLLELCEPERYYASAMKCDVETYEESIAKDPVRKMFFTKNEILYSQLLDTLEGRGFIGGKDYFIAKDFGGAYSCLAFTPVNDDRYEKLKDVFLNGFRLCN